MELLLNKLLHLTPEEIANSKIELNMHTSEGERYIDRWLKHSEEDKVNGTCEDCSYWIQFGNQKNYSEGKMAFSFLQLEDDEWLFVSAGTVLSVQNTDRAKVEILEDYKPLFGRLIIKCKRDKQRGRHVFNLSTYLDKAVIKEYLPGLYSGE